jgi:hypothetical protein
MAEWPSGLPTVPVFLMRQVSGDGDLSFLKLSVASGGIGVVVFGSEAGADRFAEAAPDYVSIPTGNFFVLRRWLSALEKNGVTHACVDPTDQRAESGHLIPIGQLLAFFGRGP